MNERIEKLAKKAGFGVYGEIYSPNDEDSPITKNIEKFAELIVAECVQVANEQKQWVEKQQPIFNYDDDKWDRARIQQSQHIVDKIKAHFGVEE